MKEHLLTEAARRSVGLAKQLAADWGQVTVLPEHLLWALLHDESLASEWLLEHGVTVESVRDSGVFDELLPQDHVSGHALPDESMDVVRQGHDGGQDEVEDEDVDATVISLTREMRLILGEATATREPVESNALREVLGEARIVARRGDVSETGSEHLLLALVAVESPVARLLRQHGGEVLRAGANVGLFETLAEPMPVDFTIDLGDDPPPVPGSLPVPDQTYRLLDAAANRAREGLRVVEDFVRFTLDDEHLSRRLKTLRHDLAGLLETLGVEQMVQARDTPGDVGTGISTPAEGRRDGVRDVVRAAFKRTQEAVRSLEEFSKVIEPSTSGEEPCFEQLGRIRYQLYTLEKAVLASRSSREQLQDALLYLLVTGELCQSDPESVVRGAIARGVRIVQVREKTLSDRELLQHARRIREITKAGNALLIMNDRPDLAVLAEADGVHVGQDELSVRDARRIVGPDRLVGVSTHSIQQARQAVLDGADYIGVGPVFPSRTKSFDEFAGLAFVSQVAAEISLPAFAIGGIDSDNIDSVVRAGGSRVAVSSAICGADDPADATDALVAVLQSR